MKRGRSTSTPNKLEAERIVASKEGPCMACEVRRESGLAGCDEEGCDYQHMKSGNIRMGHVYGYALCAWHHRRVPMEGMTPKEMVVEYGPSLMDGGKMFARAYGSEQELWERQNQLLGDGYE